MLQRDTPDSGGGVRPSFYDPGKGNVLSYFMSGLNDENAPVNGTPTEMASPSKSARARTPSSSGLSPRKSVRGRSPLTTSALSPCKSAIGRSSPGKTLRGASPKVPISPRPDSPPRQAASAPPVPPTPTQQTEEQLELANTLSELIAAENTCANLSDEVYDRDCIIRDQAQELDQSRAAADDTEARAAQGEELAKGLQKQVLFFTERYALQEVMEAKVKAAETAAGELREELAGSAAALAGKGLEVDKYIEQAHTQAQASTVQAEQALARQASLEQEAAGWKKQLQAASERAVQHERELAAAKIDSQTSRDAAEKQLLESKRCRIQLQQAGEKLNLKEQEAKRLSIQLKKAEQLQQQQTELKERCVELTEQLRTKDTEAEAHAEQLEGLQREVRACNAAAAEHGLASAERTAEKQAAVELQQDLEEIKREHRRMSQTESEQRGVIQLCQRELARAQAELAEKVAALKEDGAVKDAGRQAAERKCCGLEAETLKLAAEATKLQAALVEQASAKDAERQAAERKCCELEAEMGTQMAALHEEFNELDAEAELKAEELEAKRAARVTALEAEVAKAEERLQAAEARYSMLEGAMGKQMAGLQEEADRQCGSLAAAEARCTALQAEKAEALLKAQQEQAGSDAECAEARRKCGELEAKGAAEAGHSAALEAELAAAQQKGGQLEAEAGAAQQSARQLESALREACSEHQQTCAKLASAKAAAAAKRQEGEAEGLAQAKKCAAAAQKCEELEAESAAAHELCATLQGELGAAREEAAAAQQSAEQAGGAAESERAAAQVKRTALEGEAAAAQQQCSALQQQCASLEGESAAAQQARVTLEGERAAQHTAHRALETENAAAQQRCAALEAEAAAAQAALGALETDCSAARAECRALEGEVAGLKGSFSQVEAEISRAQQNFEEVEAEAAAARQQCTALEGELAAVGGQCAALEAAGVAAGKGLEQSRSDQVEAANRAAELEDELATLRGQLAAAEGLLQAAEAQNSQLEEDSAEMIGNLREAHGFVEAGEAVRRKLHNQVMELKGNVRVFCRVRGAAGPAATGVTGAAGARLFQFPDGRLGAERRAIQLLEPAPEGGAASMAMTGRQGRQDDKKKHAFEFDHVFQPAATQDDVFEEVSHLVQSAVDGYKVCIFAYGQTGSGKTYTMLGANGGGAGEFSLESPARGVIPRAAQKVFDTCASLEAFGWAFAQSFQMLEIYNESIRDLLADRSDAAPRGAAQEPAAAAAAAAAAGTGARVTRSSSSARLELGDSTDAPAKLEIRLDSKGQPECAGLVSRDAKCTADVVGALAAAAKRRSTRATNSNAASSRSHTVFSLCIKGANALTGESRAGVLNLVDLAGSERLSKSGAGADPQALKETQAINKSLSSLGNVIMALHTGEAHVPFRDSKLTFLLQPSLGGDCKTLMFCNVAGDVESASESLNSLRFAKKVNSCQVGKK
jgi:kinesin family protein C1